MDQSPGSILGNLIVSFPWLAGNFCEVFYTSYENIEFFLSWRVFFSFIQLINLSHSNVPQTSCQYFYNILFSISNSEIQRFLVIYFIIAGLLSSHSEAWELGHMVQAWATMQKDEGGWGNWWGFRGIKVPFFSTLASLFEPEQRVATAMRLVCLPRRGLGRAAACSDIYSGWRKQTW